MKFVKLGFIGAGQISYTSAEAVNRHAHARVIAAQDINGERLRELCARYSIPKAYQDANLLLADPEIDAVYIAVPNKFHLPLTLAALGAGKHVMLEKPFAMNFGEAQTAVTAAREAGKVLMLGMNQRFTAGSQRMRSLAAQGSLGEVYHAKAFWFRRSGIPKLGTWFCSRESAGGGCLYDIGVHLLDLCLYVLNRFDPVSVSGNTYTKFGNRGLGEGGWGKSDRVNSGFDVEDFATGYIRFSDGLSISLDVAWACHTALENRMDVHLYGTEASAHVLESKIFRRGSQESNYLTIENPESSIPFEHCERFHNFINHLLGQEELGVSLEQALAVQRILDALAESSASGHEIMLNPDHSYETKH